MSLGSFGVFGCNSESLTVPKEVLFFIACTNIRRKEK